MNISDEAVEAAKESMREVTPPPGVSKSEWLAKHGDFALIAGAIAAAAPHILADAWHEGHRRGFANGLMAQQPIGLDDAEANNPYRRQS